MSRRVAVIGAGAAGLAAGRRLVEHGYAFDILEQNDCIGGTWVYDERTGVNEFGIPIHTSMYTNLKTNLPKEIMGFPGYPILKPDDRSYIPAESILQYLRKFAEDFGILEKIQFTTRVEEVRPDGEKWLVTVRKLKSQERVTTVYDAVMVCNGHYHTPHIPVFPGIETFTGKAIHSHDYRRPDTFKDLIVVGVGAGPSGLDITLDVASAAKEVYLSHHSKEEITTPLPDNYSIKPDIDLICGSKIIFRDGTFVEPDVLLYCTGYQYSFPFLHEDCGISVENNYVAKLYKHTISIEHPTLCFVGLPFYICANQVFDLQCRFFLAMLEGHFSLISKEAMYEDEIKEMTSRRNQGYSLRQSHKMGPIQGDFYDDLARTGNIEGIPPCMAALHNESSRRFLEDLGNFRSDRYRIVNDQRFEQLPSI